MTSIRSKIVSGALAALALGGAALVSAAPAQAWDGDGATAGVADMAMPGPIMADPCILVPYTAVAITAGLPTAVAMASAE